MRRGGPEELPHAAVRCDMPMTSTSARAGLSRVRITGGVNADEPYWDHLAAGEFRVSRCANCAIWIWPTHFRCGHCGSWEVEWVQLPPEGRIYTFTRNWYAFDRTRERSEDLPYVVALVELDAAPGVRVIGLLDGDHAGLAIGAPVRGVILPPSPKSKGYATICWRLA